MGLFFQDPLFERFAVRALSHALYGGADFGECFVTAAQITPADPDSWYRAWTATADRVVQIAESCAAAGRSASAREAWLRASNYYRTSYLPLFGAPADARLVAAFDREAEAFARAAARMSPTVEAVEIPYEGTSLPGYFHRADDSGQPRPTVIATNGYDATVHEAHFAHAVAAVRRGHHCLTFDGPGQGRPLIHQGLVFRPDWENVVRPVVDYALSRPEVDPQRMALIGWSFGGYLAPRAASGEHRLAACIADPASGTFSTRCGRTCRSPLPCANGCPRSPPPISKPCRARSAPIHPCNGPSSWPSGCMASIPSPITSGSPATTASGGALNRSAAPRWWPGRKAIRSRASRSSCMPRCSVPGPWCASPQPKAPAAIARRWRVHCSISGLTTGWRKCSPALRLGECVRSAGRRGL